MLHLRSLHLRLAISISFIAVVGGLAVLAARRDKSDRQTLLPTVQAVSNTGPSAAVSRFRNLSLQPEAARLSRRLGQRFTGSDSDVSVLIGEVTSVDTRVPVRMVRQQNKQGEFVEITANGKSLTWSASDGPGTRASSSEFERSLVERLVFDSADAFILAQLSGAGYQVVGKNVRADVGGADGYDGPLWTVVRVSYSAVDGDTKPNGPARSYYINSRTGLLDKVVSEIGGEEIVATLDGWVTENGETVPSLIRWSTGGRQIMEFKVVTFARPNVK